MSLGKLAIDRPITLSMTAVAVVIFGLVSLGRLPVSLLPEVSYPTLTVECRLPGAAPVEVESLLAKPMEEAVGVVSGVERITSNSKPGIVQVKLEFGWGRDMDVAAMDVRQKLDLVELPRDAEKPRVLRYDPNEDPVLRVALSGTRNLARLRHYAEHVLKRRLESVEGVAAVRVLGGDVEEIQVDVDEGRLEEAGLTQADVASSLRKANVNAAGGSLYEEEARYLVRTHNELVSLDDVANTIVLADGARLVRLRDVATIARGAAEREVITRVGGHEAVELQVFKEGDANAVHVAARFHRALEAASPSLPPELRTVVLFDQSRFIDSAIGEVKGNALAGTVFAVVVLLLFLRDLRSTLIIALTIPISVIATFFVMQQLGATMNIMSLGGLALGVGMLVDGSIVVLEAIQRRREGGQLPRDAARDGVSEIGMAVTASVLTTVVVFVPIIFIEGVAAQLFRDQALTVTASLLVSLLVSLTLIPMLAARGRRGPTGPEARRSWAFRGSAAVVRGFRQIGWGALWLLSRACRPVGLAFDAAWGRIERGYPLMLRATLRHPLAVLAVGTAFTVLALLPSRDLALELIPPMQQGEFLVTLQAPEGTSLDRTAELAAAVERSFLASSQVESVFTSVGSSADRQAAGSSSAPNEAQIHVVLSDRGDRKAEQVLVAEARAAVAATPGLAARFERPGKLSFQAPLEVEIFGDDVDVLAQIAAQAAARLEEIPELADVHTDARSGNPEVQVRFDPDRLARLGLDASTVGAALRSRLHGEVPTRLTEGDRDIDVRVRAASLRQASVEQLQGLVVATAGGAPVVLSSLASIEPGTGPSAVRRIGQRRAAVISANLDGLDLGAATEKASQALSGIPLPSGVFPPELSGQSRELSRSSRQLGFALLLAAFLVYFVMASQFESFLHPFVILLTVPMGVAGSVLGLWLTGEPLSIVAIIGVVLLAGIVVNNAIVLVDCVNQQRAAGASVVESLVTAGSLRLRPIFMTTGTTVLGLLPMALGMGEGAELSRPLAIAVLGGMTVSTLLTLVLIPSVYLLLETRRLPVTGPVTEVA